MKLWCRRVLRWGWRALAVGLGLVLIVLLATWLLLPTAAIQTLIKREVADFVQADYGVDLSFEQLDVGLVPPRATISGLEVMGADDEPLVEVDRISVDLVGSALYRGQVAIDQVNVTRPRIRLVIDGGALINLPELTIPESEEDEEEADDGSGGFDGRVRIADGEVELIVCDPAGGDEHIMAQLDEIEVALDTVNADGGTRYDLRLAVLGGEIKRGRANIPLRRIEATARLDGEGATLPELRLELGEATVSVSEVDVAFAEPYEFDALLDASLPIEYVSDLLPQVPPLGGVVRLRGEVASRDESILGEVDVSGHDLTIELSSSEGSPLTVNTLAGEIAYIDGDLLVPRLVIERSGDGGGLLELREGVLGLEDPALPLLAELEIDDVALGRVLTEVGVEGVPVDARIDGRLSVEGGLLPLALDAEVSRLDGRELVVASGDDDPIVSLDIVSMNGSAVVEPERARLEGLMLSFGRTTLRCDAEFPFDPDSPTFFIHVAPVDSAFYLNDFGSVASLSLAGQGQVDVTISGVYADPVIDGEVALADVRVDEIEVDGVSGRIRFQGRELTIPEATATVRRSTVRVEGGSVQIAEEGVLVRATASMEPLRLADAVGLAGVSGPATKVEGQLVARAEVSYATASKTLNARLEGDLQEVGFDGVTIGSGPLAVVAERGLIEINELSLRQGEAEVDLDGTVGMNGEQPLDVELRIAALPLQALAAFLPESAPPVGGRLDVQAQVGGTTSSPAVTGRVELADGSLSGHDLGLTAFEVTLADQVVQARGQIGDDLLQVDELQLGLEGDLPLRVRALARDVELSRVLPAATLPEGTEARLGAVVLDAGLDLATLSNLDGRLTIEGLSGRQASAAIGTTGPINVRLSGTSVAIDDANITVGLPDDTSPGRVTLEHIRLETTEGFPLEGRIELDGIELAELAPEGSLPEGLTAALSGTVGFSGDLTRAAEMTADVTLSAVTVGQGDARIRTARPLVLRVGGGAVEARDVAFSVTSEDDAPGGRIRVDLVRLGLADPWPLRLRAAIGELDVPLVAGPGRLPEGLEAQAGAVINVGGDLAQPWGLRGGVTVHELSVQRGDVHVSPAGPIVLRLDGRGIELVQTELNVIAGTMDRSTSFVLGGAVSPELLDVELRGRVDLGLLAVLAEPVEEAQGALDVDIHLRGSLNEPMVLGEARLDAPRVVIAGFPGPIEGLEGSFRFSQNALLVENVRADLLGGQMRASAEVEMTAMSPEQYHAELIVRDVTWPLGLSSSATVGADIAIDSPIEGEELPLVSGDVHLARLRFSDDLELSLDINNLLRRRQSSAQNFDPNDAVVRLDLNVTGSDDLRVENNIMRAAVRFDTSQQPFTVVGTDIVPGILGLLVVEPEGEVTFRGSRFVIQRGFVTFDRGFEIDPDLEFTATTEQRDWTISLIVSGRASEVDVALRSEPVLAREDVILLLAVGMTRAEMEQMGYASALASLAPELLWGLSGFGQEAERFLPLLRSIQVTSEYNTRSGQIEPRVSMSWPVSERFRVGANTGIGNTLSARDMRIGVEYEITEQTTLDGHYGADADSTFGEFGVDVRWRREF